MVTQQCKFAGQSLPDLLSTELQNCVQMPKPPWHLVEGFTAPDLPPFWFALPVLLLKPLLDSWLPLLSRRWSRLSGMLISDRENWVKKYKKSFNVAIYLFEWSHEPLAPLWRPSLETRKQTILWSTPCYKLWYFWSFDSIYLSNGERFQLFI